MANLNLWEATFIGFKPRKLGKAKPDNCSGNCAVKIVKRLPFWISNQPFWTYKCLCCSTYQFEKGRTSFWGGIYD